MIGCGQCNGIQNARTYKEIFNHELQNVVRYGNQQQTKVSKLMKNTSNNMKIC